MSIESALDIIFGYARHKLISGYGNRIHPQTYMKRFHYGVDYACDFVPVHALEDGEIYKKGRHHSVGNYVYVKYPHQGVAVAYFHLSQVFRAKGAKVVKGTPVGVAGSGEGSAGALLHIGVRNLATWKWQNPQKWLAEYKPLTLHDYKPGKQYTLLANIKVRTGAGTGNRLKKGSELSPEDQANAQSGIYAVLKKGTVVTCLDVNGRWIETRAGWICVQQGEHVYVR